MAVIAPQTDVYLLKVPLEIDEVNQLTFANTTAQFNYFNSLPKCIQHSKCCFFIPKLYIPVS